MTEALITYEGETPFATCFMQAVAYLARRRGVPDMTSKLGPSLGFRRHSANRLVGGDRWLSATSVVAGLALSQFAEATWDTTLRRERDALDRGADLITGVDSFDIPSSYQAVEHLTHAVMVLAINSDHVIVADAMNHPEPYRIDLDDYRRTRMGVAGGGFAIVCDGLRDPVAGPADVLALLSAEVVRHRDELDILVEFAATTAEGDGLIDVADVAAERLALSQQLAALAPDLAWAGEAAQVLADLSRRWYVVYIIAREAVRGVSPPRPARLARMLGDLHAREVELNDLLSANLARSDHPVVVGGAAWRTV